MSNSSEPKQCNSGILIPALKTSPGNTMIYFFGLLYCFLGIAIAADIFMCAIEQITSATRKVKRTPKKDKLVEDAATEEGEETYDYVKIWNPTVANLTLMALGSSAPEILLSIIEIIGNDFKAGSLGPGTIVGSAAFNLFCISAICVLAVGSKAKRIELYRVFIVTAFFGTFAYLWLYLILIKISKDVVEVWEALLTLLFFPILVVAAYFVDIEIWKSKKADLREQLELQDCGMGKTIESEGITDEIKKWASSFSLPDENGIVTEAAPSIATVRKWTRTLSQTYPDLDEEDQAKILANRVSRTLSHDRLYYRIRAIRQLSSSWRKSQDEEIQKIEEIGKEEADCGPRSKTFVEFNARVYAVDQNDSNVILKVYRYGNTESSFTINYTTVNGVAKKDLNYLFKSEVLKFNSGELSKEIVIQLVQPENWRPNDVFYVHLKIQDEDENANVRLGICNVARVKYPADEPKNVTGTPNIEFVRPNYVVKENAKFSRIYVTRRGTRASLKEPIIVKYETEDITAKNGSDYRGVRDGELFFKNQEYEKYIDIEIFDDKEDEKDESFQVEIKEIESKEYTIGQKRKTIVTIISDDNALKNITNVHKLMSHYIREMKPGKATWKEQILNAVSVNGGDLTNATISDCVLHALAFPWKFAFAFLPPPTILSGYPCFVVALIAIGIVTAVVGDVASIFGCMIGFSESTVAITLVALGTSLPDTFASKIAAESESSADNAVGNVTGSNSVNVFLGLGLPWVIASIYWASKGQEFKVFSGDLGISVAVFMICSVLFLSVLVLRRKLKIFGRGELGGPFGPKILSGLFFIALWVVYVAVSIYNFKKQA
ncbi:unnamed protein product [Caenorhabditis angaria]|uniref:Calx-beta domain-containing protein n=1 Tax=Caenorhabditis angaria TaxID=860376 RepID=A0A9P1IPM5_9PELO|nr:unnamed protein product [Caenorhabditis angaria]